MARKSDTAISARGEPWLWLIGGALALGVSMILALLALILWNGAAAFWPKPIEVLTLTDGKRLAGERVREERFAGRGGEERRTLYRVGNFDIYGDDFRWVPEREVALRETPRDMLLIERLEWGVFVGRIDALAIGAPDIATALDAAKRRLAAIRRLERDQLGRVNREMEEVRLELRRVEIRSGRDSPVHRDAATNTEARLDRARAEYDRITGEIGEIKSADAKERATLIEVGGERKDIPISAIVRLLAPNDLSVMGKLAVYAERWWEFLSEEPREANTEGGVLPAIFGTVAMTLILAAIVAPFGVITALYLREYARQGRIVSIVRISVNNLAGVPSIVYGVFGLGFFAYLIGGGIDALFFPERLPNPTFGTGGILWASLTLALLTVPVVIVATEEALAAVPRSMREGSLACGASKWQTIRRVVLPRALPGIMTGLILAMARGAGEVAPLMLVGVVKLAPDLPIDGIFPYFHPERSFMHLGFHIYDVGFQSRNSEAGKPMVFVTVLLLIALVATLNAVAIVVRSRLRRRFAGSQF
jgi:phosphate transport system permease protein